MGYLKEALSSGTERSSKRLITFVAAILMFVVALVDLFTDYTITDYVYEGLSYIAMAGLGSIAAEAFAKKTTDAIQNTPQSNDTGTTTQDNVII